MKLRKLLTTLLTAIGIASAGNASAIIIGGIDFGALGTTGHLETTTLAETLVNAPGQTLTGYGQVDTVNGDNTYCAADPNCKLFFSFTYNTQAFTGLAAAFNLGSVTVYYDPVGATRNLLGFSSLANLAYINALTPWVQLDGHNFFSTLCGILTGVPNPELCAVSLGGNVNVSFEGSGLLDVVLGGLGLPAVQAYLNGNSEIDGLGGFADLTMNTSGSNTLLNPNDTCTGDPGQFCLQGSADIRGSTVIPEPGTLALLGIGLLAGVGFGVLRRKKAAA